MPISGIFFDAADVFYRRPEPTDAHVQRLLQAHGLPTELSADDRRRQKAVRSLAKRGLLTPPEFWSQFFQAHGVVDAGLRQSLAGQMIAYANSVLPIPGGREALAGLRQRGFILGIITDSIYPIEWKMRWLDLIGVAELVDVVACSTVLGLHKPDPAMYLSAVRQAQLVPADAAFVGHAADELDGARRAGMATVAVHYEPGSQADYYAASLLELLNVPIFQESPGREV